MVDTDDFSEFGESSMFFCVFFVFSFIVLCAFLLLQAVAIE